MESYDSFEYELPGKEQEEGWSEGDGGKIEWKLSEVITRAVSREEMDRQVQDCGR